MRDKFEYTQAERIGDLLNSSSFPMQSFLVPRFQRNYAWRSDDEVTKLWTDVYDNYAEHIEDNVRNLFEGQYMLGPMVLLQDKTGEFEWQVIDGQQRLATLTTLFCVMRDIYFTLNLVDDDGYKLVKKLIEKKMFEKKNENEFRLKLNHTDKEFFAMWIQKESSPDAKLSSWREYIKEQKKSTPASHKLLMRCYEELYYRVSSALVTGFVPLNDINDKVDDLGLEFKKEIMSDMVASPSNYLLPEDFFQRHWDGKGFVLDKKISKSERDKYESIKTKPSGKKYKDVNSYVEYTIKQKEKKFAKAINEATKGKREVMLRKHGAKNISMLTRFLEFVIQQNFVVSVKVGDENDAFMIFETLNARGKRLSKSELVKNMCFSVVKNDREIERLDTRWLDIFNEDLKSGDRFIRESLRSRYFEKYEMKDKRKLKISTANLFKIISDKINKDVAEVKKYIDELEVDSKFVKFMDVPTSYTDDDKTKNVLIAVERLEAVNIRVPLLTGFRRKWNSEQEFIEFASALIKFHFRNRTIGKMHPSDMERLMMDVAEKVQNNVSLTEILMMLRERDAGDDEFEEGFYRFRSEESEVIKYVLLEIEKHLRGDHAVIQLQPDATVEHVLPKTPGKDWNEDEFFVGWNKVDNRDFKSHCDRIGNMTLLSRGPNSKIKNRSFCIKKTEAYTNDSETLILTKETVLKMAKCADELDISKPEFENIKEWTAMLIDERSRCFSKLARMIWDL